MSFAVRRGHAPCRSLSPRICGCQELGARRPVPLLLRAAVGRRPALTPKLSRGPSMVETAYHDFKSIVLAILGPFLSPPLAGRPFRRWRASPCSTPWYRRNGALAAELITLRRPFGATRAGFSCDRRFPRPGLGRADGSSVFRRLGLGLPSLLFVHLRPAGRRRDLGSHYATLTRPLRAEHPMR